MINILIRTHNKPNEFARCIKSIESQTYKNWKITISADSGMSEEYVKKCGHDYIMLNWIARLYHDDKYWNLYNNILQISAVKGYILYMDDDVIFTSENALRLVAKNCEKDKLLVFKYQLRKDGAIVPRDNNWGKHLGRGSTNSEVFCHPVEYKVEWKPVCGGDWFAANELQKKLDITWLNEIILTGTE